MSDSEQEGFYRSLLKDQSRLQFKFWSEVHGRTTREFDLMGASAVAQNLLDKCGKFLPETGYAHHCAYGFDGGRGSASTPSADAGGDIDVSYLPSGEFQVWLIQSQYLQSDRQ